MKIKFLATAQAPIRYEIEGETIIAYEVYAPAPEPEEPEDDYDEPVVIEDQSIVEAFDLSALEIDGEFLGVEPEFLSLSGSQIIRSARRDENGELWVELCQRSIGGGNWLSSDWFDSILFEPGQRYIYKQGQPNPTPQPPEPPHDDEGDYYYYE